MQNIVIAVGTVAVLLLGVPFGGVTMAAGMLVHEASVLVVIVNAMRLLRRRTEAISPPRAAIDGTQPERKGSAGELTLRRSPSGGKFRRAVSNLCSPDLGLTVFAVDFTRACG